MPYKYIVSVDSKGFDEASDEMLRALGRLTWATERAVSDSGDRFLPPNELLTLGYFDEMKIGVCVYAESRILLTQTSIMMMANPHLALRLPHSHSVRRPRC